MNHPLKDLYKEKTDKLEVQIKSLAVEYERAKYLWTQIQNLSKDELNQINDLIQLRTIHGKIPAKFKNKDNKSFIKLVTDYSGKDLELVNRMVTIVIEGK